LCRALLEFWLVLVLEPELTLPELQLEKVLVLVLVHGELDPQLRDLQQRL
jgi:hypothetical protein